MITQDPLERFQDALQRELAWRKKEMSSLLLAGRSTIGDAQRSAIRSGIVLTYAHLEGFVRQGARQYFKFVRAEQLPYRDLTLNFLALKVSRLVNEPTTKASYYHRAAELLVTKLDDRAELPSPEVITARSNLNFEQFGEILYCINIDPSVFSTKKNFIDAKLLEKRNAIAHGQFREVDLAEYEELHSGVIEIIDQFSELLVSSATHRSYCNPTGSRPSPVTG